MRENPSSWKKKVLTQVRLNRAWARENHPGPVSDPGVGGAWARGRNGFGALHTPLFHATLGLSGVAAEGLLSQDEVRSRGKARGLGGGQEHTVSFTPWEEGAILIAAAHMALNSMNKNGKEAWETYLWFRDFWFPWAGVLGIPLKRLREAIENTSRSHREVDYFTGELKANGRRFQPAAVIYDVLNMYGLFSVGLRRTPRHQQAFSIPAIMSYKHDFIPEGDIGWVKAFVNVDFLAAGKPVQGDYPLVSNLLPAMGLEDVALPDMKVSQPYRLLECRGESVSTWDADKKTFGPRRKKTPAEKRRERQQATRARGYRKTLQFVAEGAIAAGSGNESEKDEIRVCPEDVTVVEVIPLHSVAHWTRILEPEDCPEPTDLTPLRDSEEELKAALLSEGKL